jgi:hypothetical protein
MLRFVRAFTLLPDSGVAEGGHSRRNRPRPPAPSVQLRAAKASGRTAGKCHLHLGRPLTAGAFAAKA